MRTCITKTGFTDTKVLKGGGKTASCAVTVSTLPPGYVSVTSVSLSASALGFTLGETVTASLTAAVIPANATNPAITWASSNAGVARVSGGVVTAVGPGTANITVTTADGGATASCAVTVTSPVTDRDLTALITAPAAGAPPAASAINTAQYTGTVAWQTSSGAPHTGAFQMNTVYKAVVTLSASQHYTFSGVPANAFSYSGASSVANSVNNGTVTITFPRTAGTVSAANLAAYLANLPSNTSSTPYTVAVASDTLAGIKDAVRNSGKYVHLDLSACSVTTIGEGAFGWCRSLASVTFAGSNTSIGLDVFPEGYYDEGGNSLKNAYLAANPRSGTYTRAAPSGSTWTKQ